jgi:hypothetical protein
MHSTPLYDWPIGFKGGKGMWIWINLGIAITSGHTVDSITPRRDWTITKIYSNSQAFVALKADGSITAWGNWGYEGSRAPDGNEGAPLPPQSELPHAVIEPSALRAAKAYPVE